MKDGTMIFVRVVVDLIKVFSKENGEDAARVMDEIFLEFHSPTHK